MISLVKVGTVYSKLIATFRENCHQLHPHLVNKFISELGFIDRNVKSKLEKWRPYFFFDRLKLNFVSNFSSTDLKNCVTNGATLQLSDIEYSLILAQSHNAKVRFILRFCNAFRLDCKEISSDYLINYAIHLKVKSHFAKRDVDIILHNSEQSDNTARGNKRYKRWFFSGFASAVTGLATSESVDKLTKNEENLKKLAEERNTEEIIKLETKISEFLESRVHS